MTDSQAGSPAPLTPPECDLTDFAFMPLDVARLRDSELAAEETPEACWAAVLLWGASWHQLPAGSIPDNDRWMAKAAGYLSKGKIDKAWADVRTGALRGWVLCSDGRLYHPVVAEKAREAWQAKLRQRWGTECSRIKKHNDRHPGADVPKPTFEEWLSQGCPQGQPLPVPRDKPPMSPECPEKTVSKRQGEGQGQGHISTPSSPPAADPPAGSAGADPAQKGGARKKHGTPEDHDVARWLFDAMKAVHPTVREPNFDTWANDVRLMREVDDRTHHDICALFRWAQGDAFWASNVMSPDKLREKWDQLTAKREQAGRRPLAALASAPTKYAAAAAAIYGPDEPSAATQSADEGVIDVEARQAA